HLAGRSDSRRDLFPVLLGVEIFIPVARVPVGADHVVETVGKGDALAVELEGFIVKFVGYQLDGFSGNDFPVMKRNVLRALAVVVDDKARSWEPLRLGASNSTHILRLLILFFPTSSSSTRQASPSRASAVVTELATNPAASSRTPQMPRSLMPSITPS